MSKVRKIRESTTPSKKSTRRIPRARHVYEHSIVYDDNSRSSTRNSSTKSDSTTVSSRTRLRSNTTPDGATTRCKNISKKKKIKKTVVTTTDISLSGGKNNTKKKKTSYPANSIIPENNDSEEQELLDSEDLDLIERFENLPPMSVEVDHAYLEDFFNEDIADDDAPALGDDGFDVPGAPGTKPEQDVEQEDRQNAGQLFEERQETDHYGAAGSDGDEQMVGEVDEQELEQVDQNNDADGGAQEEENEDARASSFAPGEHDMEDLFEIADQPLDHDEENAREDDFAFADPEGRIDAGDDKDLFGNDLDDLAPQDAVATPLDEDAGREEEVGQENMEKCDDVEVAGRRDLSNAEQNFFEEEQPVEEKKPNKSNYDGEKIAIVNKSNEEGLVADAAATASMDDVENNCEVSQRPENQQVAAVHPEVEDDELDELFRDDDTKDLPLVDLDDPLLAMDLHDSEEKEPQFSSVDVQQQYNLGLDSLEGDHRGSPELTSQSSSAGPKKNVDPSSSIFQKNEQIGGSSSSRARNTNAGAASSSPSAANSNKRKSSRKQNPVIAAESEKSKKQKVEQTSQGGGKGDWTLHHVVDDDNSSGIFGGENREQSPNEDPDEGAEVDDPLSFLEEQQNKPKNAKVKPKTANKAANPKRKPAKKPKKDITGGNYNGSQSGALVLVANDNQDDGVEHENNQLAVLSQENMMKPWEGEVDESLPLQEQRLLHRERTQAKFSLYSKTSNIVPKAKSGFELWLEEEGYLHDDPEAAWKACPDQAQYFARAKDDVNRYEEELNEVHGVRKDAMFSLIMLAGKRSKNKGAPASKAQEQLVVQEPDEFANLFGNTGAEAGSSGNVENNNEEEENALAMFGEDPQPADNNDVSGNNGPVAQVRLDENGEIVIEDNLNMENGQIVDAKDNNMQLPEHSLLANMANLGSNHKRRKAAQKWTVEDTKKFYEAVSAFGYDLVLIGSVFPQKTAAQVKAKYTQEMKKNPDLMDGAFMEKKDCKKFFEKEKWKIDESKHWRPPLANGSPEEEMKALENGAADDFTSGDFFQDMGLENTSGLFGGSPFINPASSSRFGPPTAQGGPKKRFAPPGQQVGLPVSTSAARPAVAPPPAPKPDTDADLFDALFYDGATG
ncbi:unnamed protein product [Amoebophrya sp. A120]|nr:unnamed protein product [Amoebophrya sp. A120]|eukprot:GSA120T00024034001.1